MNKTVLLLVLGLTACVPASPDAALIETAKSAVGRLLKDPSSAEYRDVSVIKRYCVFGEVNSKNSYGGYVGFTKFVYDSKRNKTMLDPNTNETIDIDNLNERLMQAQLDFSNMGLKCLGRTEE